MSNSYRYDISRDGLADLALAPELERRLSEAIRDDNGAEIEDAIEEAVNARIAEHGVTAEGEWLGDWHAEHIVRDVLARYGA